MRPVFCACLAYFYKSYAERLFSFPNIGALEKPDAVSAIRQPVLAEGATIDPKALAEIYRLTQGYPYFLQEWGYQAWNHAPNSPILIDHVHAATATSQTRLDQNFFRVRFDRLTPSEKRFLQAMAQLPESPYRIGDIAASLNIKVGSLSPRRASLIRKGMIYSPVYGDIDFTVPPSLTSCAESCRSNPPNFRLPHFPCPNSSGTTTSPTSFKTSKSVSTLNPNPASPTMATLKATSRISSSPSARLPRPQTPLSFSSLTNFNLPIPRPHPRQAQLKGHGLEPQPRRHRLHRPPLRSIHEAHYAGVSIRN